MKTKTRSIVPLDRSVAILVAFAFALSATVAANAGPQPANVKVFPDRYVVAGNSFHELVALEAWAKQSRIRALALDICSPSATKQLLAAVERFHMAYLDGIHIRTLLPGEVGCGSDRDYYMTDENGRSMLP